MLYYVLVLVTAYAISSGLHGHEILVHDSAACQRIQPPGPATPQGSLSGARQILLLHPAMAVAGSSHSAVVCGRSEAATTAGA